MFIEQGNANLNADGLINWEKRKLIYSIVSKVLFFQQADYEIERNKDIPLFFFNGVLDDKEMFQRSLQAEPRDEKDK
jgi:hypothetical protein